ncbi:hypothetical protein BCR43DRAFT_6742 [Syncephalastrum racemosum]|uniref:Kelch repeat protein n=1 Tax=Syncephalastrum racemosum TaxID=13706 RepID=A0A1X2HTB9_SYNRA|nr:hypothetical protein BCR43DRAFT_6742 [Syncephalastrum racemosum]
MYALDLSEGVDANCPAWVQPNNVTTNSQFQPFMYGVAFKQADNSIAVQSGDGGSNEMSSLVAYRESGGWQIVSEYGQAPAPRAGMSASANASGTAFYFGGRSVHSSNNKYYYYDFYEFDSARSQWNWPSINYGWGQPPARYDHSSHLIGDQLFIMGGTAAYDDSLKFYADFGSVLVFDVVNYKAMSMATIGDIPPTRYSFASAIGADGHSIVVFGGQNTSTSTFDSSTDVYSLDTCTLEWTKKDVSGNGPAGRVGARAVTYGDYMVIMFGLSNGTVDDQGTFNPMYTNEVAILDTKKWEWVKSAPAGQSTAPGTPSCSLDFPNFPEAGTYGGDAAKPYDPTVIKNPRAPKGLSTQNKAITVVFALLGAALIGGLIWWCLRRQRRQARATNPRWLPGAIANNKSSSNNSSASNNDYPLFVYNNLDDNEKAIGGDKDTTKTYTATDHAQWERALDQDAERPEDGRPMTRHSELWERMRNLSENHTESAMSEPKQGKLVDA